MKKQRKIYFWQVAIPVLLLLSVPCGILVTNRIWADNTITTLLAESIEKNEGNSKLNFLSSLSDSDKEKIVREAVRAFNRLLKSDSGLDQNFLSELQLSISDLGLGITQEQIKALSDRLAECYLENSENTDKNFSEIQNNIKDITETMNTQFQENLNTVSDYLSQLDDTVINNQSQLTMITQNQEENHKQLNVDFVRLQDSLSDIHSQITSTQAEIANLLQTVEQNAGLRQEELFSNMKQIKSSIQEIHTALSKINTDMSQAHADLKSLIHNLQNSVDSNQLQILSELGNLEKDMAEQSAVSLTQILDTCSSLETMLSTSAEELQNAITSLSSDMTLNFDAISAKGDTLKACLDELRTTFDNDLKSVFTSVSDGKMILASALLTKGVTLNEDATFEQFKEAILSVPQQLQIGVEQLPGEISYDYHYHEDPSGNCDHSATSTVSGGCYTVPVYHRHSRGGGCYRDVGYHIHNSHCPSHPIWVDWVKDPYWGKSYDCGGSPDNATRTELTCSKSTGTVDYYTPGCGLSDGQIIAAHIVYRKNSGDSETADDVPVGKEVLPM